MKNIRILVPVDFSELSYAALETANQLAILFEGTVTPIHIWVEPPRAEEYSYSVNLSYDVDYVEVGKELTQKLNDVASDKIDQQLLKPVIVKKGMPASSILSNAIDFDIIVMASKGLSGFQRYLLGSVTEEVVKSSKIPVMIVKQKSLQKSLKKILVTTDFTDNSMAAFPTVMEFVKKTGAKLDLVHVASYDLYPMFGLNTESYTDEIVERIQKRLKTLISDHLSDIKEQVNPKVITTPKSAHESLAGFIEKNEYDLVVMSTMGTSGLRYLLLGSTTANVLRHSPSPILVVRPKAKEKSSEVHK
ncbi:MAG: universal stress protein [Balneolales bacterium]